MPRKYVYYLMDFVALLWPFPEDFHKIKQNGWQTNDGTFVLDHCLLMPITNEIVIHLKPQGEKMLN